MMTMLANITNPMSSELGWTITSVYLALFVLIIATKLLLRYKIKKYYPLQDALMIILSLLPASFMLMIGPRWEFSSSYLPTNNPVVDLTYSGFHIAFLIFMLVSSIGGAYVGLAHRHDTTSFFKGRMNKIDYTIFRLGLFLLTIEIYKQLIFANLWYGLDEYQWYAFPLQFCSVPLFFFIIAPWLKNKILKQSIYEFIALFITVAGLAVMIVGGSVFTSNVSISVHTMLWHGAMAVAGIYLIFAQGIGTSLRQLFRACLFLFVLIILVQVVNIHFHFMGEYIENGPSGFSGFFISPWETSFSMPVLGAWQKALYEGSLPRAVATIIYSIIYFFAFSLGATIVYGITYLIHQVLAKKQHKVNVELHEKST